MLLCPRLWLGKDLDRDDRDVNNIVTYLVSLSLIVLKNGNISLFFYGSVHYLYLGLVPKRNRLGKPFLCLLCHGFHISQLIGDVLMVHCWCSIKKAAFSKKTIIQDRVFQKRKTIEITYCHNLNASVLC